MKKIYLLSPWVEEKYNTTQSSLEYIRFYLIDSGYEAEIIDCSKYKRDLNDVIQILIRDEKPIVGITAYTRERFNAYHLIRKVGREIPDSLIVVGGRHFGFLAEETLRELPEVDIVVRGEGENTFKEICDSVYNATRYEDILGVSYKKGNRIIHNPDRPIESDLDKFRNYDINNIQKDACLSHTKVDHNNLYFTVSATRGCPNNCVYCSLTATRVRFRSIDKIIEEIEAKIDATGVRNVSFNDSSLTLNKQFISNLCNKIIEKKLNIHWNCYSRVNIDTGLLKLMKKAGMVSAEIGLESGSPRVLKSIRKRINLEQIEKFCNETYHLGIKLYVFCLISLPDETKEDADMTINFVKKLSKYIYYAGMQTTRILPDAALYRIAVEKNVLPEDFSWFNHYEKSDTYNVSHFLYRTLPIYSEHLPLKTIKEYLDEFDTIHMKNFIYFDTVRQAIKNTVRKESFKSITFKNLMQKFSYASCMLISAYRNKKKEEYFS